jgi:protein SCO1
MSATTAGQQHPIGIYLKVWLLLFVLSTFSYLVDFFHIEGYLRWTLILLFMFLKAGFIVAIFMHVAWERLALKYVLFVPLSAIAVLITLMAIEGDYTFSFSIARCRSNFSVSPRAKLLFGFLLANMAIAVTATLVLLNRPAAPPQIQGVLLPQARMLPNFRLLDHHNRVFTNEDLKGRWHLVAYGFTTCPDICPTVLSQLAMVKRRLQEQDHTDLRVLFYTVDHRRDTVAQMASYVPYFDPGFIGPFEQGLGIVAQRVPATGPNTDPADNEYGVVHGVTLFLINPKGELQAIFQPDYSRRVPNSFNPDTVQRDYLAIRRYLG